MIVHYFSPSQNAFYDGQLRADYIKAGSWPNDAKEVKPDVFIKYGLSPCPDGKIRGVCEAGLPCWVDSIVVVDLEKQERLWRDNQLLLADVEINKIEDCPSVDKKLLKGWRQYRVLLRNWPESENFPKEGLRPQPPTTNTGEK